MKTIIIPGYGDRTDYLKPTITRWRKKFGHEPEVIVFGWRGSAEAYDQNWDRFSKRIRVMGEVGIIGISAGASVAARALQVFPEVVKRVVTVCGPLDVAHMSENTLVEKYPLLKRSLDMLSIGDIKAEKVLTLRPLLDEVVSVRAMQLPGATDKRIAMIGHAISIAWGMFHYADEMHDFLQPSA